MPKAPLAADERVELNVVQVQLLQAIPARSRRVDLNAVQKYSYPRLS
jgi:hypothetical protein